MVALSVDVEDFIVGFHEGLVRSTWKVTSRKFFFCALVVGCT